MTRWNGTAAGEAMPATIRPAVAAAMILMLSTMLAACGGVAGGPQPTATFGPAVQTRLAGSSRLRPTRTPTNETARAATPTATAVPALPTPEQTEPEPATPLPDPETEALLLALLTLGDMPEGWHGGDVYTKDGSTSGMTGDDEMFTTPRQQDACGYNFDDPYLNKASAYFEDGAQEFLVLHQVMLYADGPSAEILMSQMQAAMERCPEVEEPLDDGSTSISRFTLLADPQIGDQSCRFQITSSDDEFDYAIVVTGFRVGRVLSYVLQFGSLELSGPVDGWGTNDIAIRAVDKISSLRETFDSLESPSENVV